MEQRISLVTLGVADLARARRFYEEGLGWRPSGASNDEIVVFPIGSLAFALYSAEALAADAGVPQGSGFGRLTLAHNVATREQVDLVLAEAEAAGARILKAAEDTFWGGYAGCFADPDGHVFEVAWNPHWPLRADGSIQLPP